MPVLYQFSTKEGNIPRILISRICTGSRIAKIRADFFFTFQKYEN